MSQYKSILIFGFAIFAMFFGSGNLVFPLQIGFADGNHWLPGFFGLLMTGIILPFLGLFVIKLHKGNYHTFFGEAGKVAGIVLPLVMLSLLGSFGVVPRCITVAHGSMMYLLPHMSTIIFNLLFCIATYICCLNDRVMMNLLGKWMSPILLISLFILIVVAFMQAPAAEVTTNAPSAFLLGFHTGYQTMDLFAAFFFSSLTFAQIQHLIPNGSSNRQIVLFALKPSIIAAVLLAVVYLGFVYLGAHYAFLIQHVAPESMLPTIAQYTMGNHATLLIGAALLFSCLSTAVALNNLYARYICTVLKLRDQAFYLVLLATTGVAFVISLLDFRGIALFLQPILEVSYPGLITLTLTSILFKRREKLKTSLFYLITALTIAYTLVS